MVPPLHPTVVQARERCQDDPAFATLVRLVAGYIRFAEADLDDMAEALPLALYLAYAEEGVPDAP